MATFEDLRLKDLLAKFRAEVIKIRTERNLSGLKAAGARLQDVYNFFLTASSDFTEEQEQLKNMFSSFNYAAVIVNGAIKNGGLKGDDGELLDECLEIMTRCCDSLTASLDKK